MRLPSAGDSNIGGGLEYGLGNEEPNGTTNKA